jgi:hypothetical protein
VHADDKYSINGYAPVASGLLALMKADSVAAITAIAAVVNGGAIQKAKQIGKAIKRIGRRPFALEDDGAQLFFPVGHPVGSVSVTAREPGHVV